MHHRDTVRRSTQPPPPVPFWKLAAPGPGISQSVLSGSMKLQRTSGTRALSCALERVDRLDELVGLEPGRNFSFIADDDLARALLHRSARAARSSTLGSSSTSSSTAALSAGSADSPTSSDLISRARNVATPTSTSADRERADAVPPAVAGLASRCTSAASREQQAEHRGAVLAEDDDQVGVLGLAQVAHERLVRRAAR